MEMTLAERIAVEAMMPMKKMRMVTRKIRRGTGSSTVRQGPAKRISFHGVRFASLTQFLTERMLTRPTSKST